MVKIREGSMEQYDEYGEIIKPLARLNTHQQHRVHQTKDMFAADCFLCQKDAEKGVKTYWADDE